MPGTFTITPARATATIVVSSFASIGASATITVNGIVLTNGVEWNAATSNNATATSIASAITTATATTLTTAAAVGSTVTISSNVLGPTGNTVTLASSDAVRLLISGATLSGGSSGIIGTSGAPLTIYGASCTAGADLCNIDLYDGTSASGTLVLRLSCAASAANNFNLKQGVVFKNGCFADITVTDITKSPTTVEATYTKI